MVCRTASLGSGAVKHQGFPGPRISATHADGQPASTSLAQRTSSSMRAPAPARRQRPGPVYARTHSASDPLDAAPATLDAKSRHDYPRIFTGQHARRARTWPAIRGSGATVALHRRRPGARLTKI